MAQTKLTLKSFGTITGGDNFWIVDQPNNAELLEKRGGAGVLLSLDGQPLSEWTQSKGVGDWSEYVGVLKHGSVQLAISPMVATATKTQNFLKELRRTLGGAGAATIQHKIPAGSSVTGLLKDADVSEFLHQQRESNRMSGELKFEVERDDVTDSDFVYNIATRDFDFHWSDEDGGFLTLKKGPKLAYVLSGGVPNIYNYLTTAFHEDYDRVLPRKYLNDAVKALEAKCDASESRVRKLAIRAAKSPATGRVWVDLGRRDGLFGCINENGVGMDFTADPDVFFKRTDMVKELPKPEIVAEADVQGILNGDFRKAFNISDEEFPMVAAWLVTQIVPSYSAPVAMFLGESGSGKTTATSVLSTILENTEDNGALMPEGKDNLAVTISQEKISLWNNVSKISNSSSDDICQYIDGASYRKRKLHSNNGVVSMTLEPSILLNGISFEDDLRPDLKTRSIVFNMGKMHVPTGSIDEIVSSVRRDHSRILGAVYTLVSQVMREMKDTELPVGSRMADYLKAIIIIDKMWNLNGATYNRYIQSSSEMSFEATEGAAFQVIHRAVVEGAQINEAGVYQRTFTNGELVSLLTNYQSGISHRVDMELMDLKLDKATPMTSHLNRHITDWKKFGVNYIDHGNKMVDGVRATRKTFTFDPASSQGAWLNHVELAEMVRIKDMARGF